MRVFLVAPKLIGEFHNCVPLGLGYVGAASKKAGHEVLLIDLHHKKSPSVSSILQSFKPDVVGVTGMSSQYNQMKDIAHEAKKAGVMVVSGGHHVSNLTEFVLNNCKDIDYVIKGEGEVVFPELLSNLESPEGLLGVYYRRNGQVEGNSPKLIEDLDSLSYPWNVLNPKDYFSFHIHGMSSRSRKSVPVVSTRGCPYGCTFCSASEVHGKKIRVRSVENFLDELEFLSRNFGIKEVQVIDDNFTFYRDRAYGVAQGIIDRNLDIYWTLPNGIRADRVDYELLKKMKESGCYFLGIGIESGSERILKEVGKPVPLEVTRKAIVDANKLGYLTQGLFMMGFPGETLEDLDKTESYACSLPLNRISINTLVPLPGSKLFQDYLGNKWVDLATIDWTGFRSGSYVPKAKFLENGDMLRFRSRLYKKFYFRPSKVFGYLRKVRSFNQFLSIVTGLIVLLGQIRMR